MAAYLRTSGNDWLVAVEMVVTRFSAGAMIHQAKSLLAAYRAVLAGQTFDLQMLKDRWETMYRFLLHSKLSHTLRLQTGTFLLIRDRSSPRILWFAESSAPSGSIYLMQTSLSDVGIETLSNATYRMRRN